MPVFPVWLLSCKLSAWPALLCPQSTVILLQDGMTAGDVLDVACEVRLVLVESQEAGELIDLFSTLFV